MIESNSDTMELSYVEKGRELLERGEVSSAVEWYGRAFDPESLDEAEARSMLIEARSQLSRKHLLEALEFFEEALLMGTDVQRRQALEGIATVGETRTRLPDLRVMLKRGLEETLGSVPLEEFGLAFVSDSDNLVLIAVDMVEALPPHLSRGKRIFPLPQHLYDHELTIRTDKCIPYTDEEDVRYILEVATWLNRRHAERVQATAD
jgi:hypothetical protein